MLSLLAAPLSALVARSGAGRAGAGVSIVTVSEPEAALVLPATSVALALIEWLPSASVVVVIEYGLAAPLLLPVAPSKSCTEEPFSAVPSKLGVESLVMSSLFELPLSELAFRSGVEGAAGAAVSIVTVRVPYAALFRSAASVALALIAWSPSASGVVVIE